MYSSDVHTEFRLVILQETLLHIDFHWSLTQSLPRKSFNLPQSPTCPWVGAVSCINPSNQVVHEYSCPPDSHSFRFVQSLLFLWCLSPLQYWGFMDSSPAGGLSSLLVSLLNGKEVSPPWQAVFPPLPFLLTQYYSPPQQTVSPPHQPDYVLGRRSLLHKLFLFSRNSLAFSPLYGLSLLALLHCCCWWFLSSLVSTSSYYSLVSIHLGHFVVVFTFFLHSHNYKVKFK